ncbi:1,4-dihydroxy-2-naphthoate octaprenyltransferase [Dysgonomonas massiliensis]|uniref:1,4-dihydroxy-2-naphthoate octaprenyltransferase n=1 Tax=Dysgonomonas massiliensis TaxID=2040292 RepID=UPI000C794114|nr:1,4-dihydroxy-2-naphthoate octaprenyltransferase [Dysgonomonas massiliensis]
MASLKSWVSAFRPRTLFLAVGTAVCGSGMAYYGGKFSWWIFVLTVAIAAILQLLSNLANDLGDFQHGTDTTGERLGPQRAMQSGAITYVEMKRAIYITVLLSAVIGVLLVYSALQFLSPIYIIAFLLIGLLAIIAALKYTVGDNPYGYKGMGDVFSFVFFGPVPVVGTYFLHTHELNFFPWLPAIGLGLLSAAVLNTNNMRDLDNDRNAGKITVPVRIGLANAKKYHAFLILGTLFCFIAFNLLYMSSWYQCLYLVVFVAFLKILTDVFRITDNKALDPYLKFTSVSTFFLSLFFVICINL